MNKKLLTIPPKPILGKKVALVSPSAGLAPFAMHRIKNSTFFLNKLGFEVVFSRYALENLGYTSADAQKRAEDINEMFSDKSVTMIISTIGGNHSNQILKYLDFEVIKKNPKVFIGYSDITVLHFAIQKKANLVTYYGPMAMTQFGEYPQPFSYTVDYFDKVFMDNNINNIHVSPSKTWTDEVLDWFKKEDFKRPRKLKKNNGYKWLKEGKCEGFAWGGALESINHLAGTDYWLSPNKAVVFLDIPEGNSIYESMSVSNIDSYLADFENLKIFENINGLIIGRPYCFNKDQIEAFEKLILNYTKDYNYPVLFNVNLGHSDPIITLPYGSSISLDSDKNSFEISLK